MIERYNLSSLMLMSIEIFAFGCFFFNRTVTFGLLTILLYSASFFRFEVLICLKERFLKWFCDFLLVPNLGLFFFLPPQLSIWLRHHCPGDKFSFKLAYFRLPLSSGASDLNILTFEKLKDQTICENIKLFGNR